MNPSKKISEHPISKKCSNLRKRCSSIKWSSRDAAYGSLRNSCIPIYKCLEDLNGKKKST
ncbi:hypothetical protein PGB90_002068 [Kerria lacca]